ncbi:response regulator transcription factor [Frigoribacterium sp. PvP032]|uniref:response regulator n=1 Tax=Frigoribacterium sp. PvP032 TaxID=2806589 RepID=UPI001AE2F730|nr:response regulator transcription factor [Frigoribacterium sp. PvP032]MBP1191019.1 DNA-binding NarL/FixJ family response regulator [Frigoribacterium sp. PvP032]
MIRVVVVDDHPLVRQGLRSLVDQAEGIVVVEEAADGERGVAAAALHRPDVVLMDLSMPGIGGVEATRRIVAADPSVHVVVLTSVPDASSVREALAAGAVGYLLKDAEPATVVAGVRAAAEGGAPLDPRAARALLPDRSAPQTPGPDRAAAIEVPGQAPLVSGREAEVLRLVARGLANKQIGTALGISERTVKAHVGSVFRRIGVADRTSAALWARDNGY